VPRDQLFLLKPDFTDGTKVPYYCPSCATLEGVLSFYPRLRDVLDVQYLDFPRPRQAVITAIGAANQGLPVLVIAPENASDPALTGLGISRPLQAALPQWLQDPDWAKPALILMGLWGAGAGMIIWLAGLQGVPQHLYEAAEIDGATVWQKFRHVTWPLLSPTTLFIFTMAIIAGFQVFGQIYMLTDGKATPETQVYVYNIYQEAFVSLRMGYASALACALFAIILAVTLTQLSLTKRWVHYG